MTGPEELETPENIDSLYLARAGEVEEFAHRPLFTGDVLQVASDRTVALLQHPCSMRRRRVLVPRLIAAAVKPATEPPPSKWHGNYRFSYLPSMNGDANAVIEFDDVDVIPSSDAQEAERLAILSQRGVNLLLQRWIHHQSRVIVPTIKINEMIEGQFEEADLIGDEVSDLVAQGWSACTALSRVEDWLDEGGKGNTHRQALADPQKRSSVRRDLRTQVRTWAVEK